MRDFVGSRSLGPTLVAWLGLAALACSGKSRPFSDEVLPLEGAGGAGAAALPAPEGAPAANATLGEASLDDPELTAPPPDDGTLAAGALGATCASGADCVAPGLCVDGVCCSSACTDLCAACDMPGAEGTCSAALADLACPVLACPGFDTECRTLDQTELSLNCEALGQCKLQTGCASIPAAPGTVCQAGAGSCDGGGLCVVTGKAVLGAACTADADCAEGHCIAGADATSICCDTACDGACQECSPAGRCEVFPQQDERCEAVACPPDDVCRDYTADATARQCRSFGQCQTGRDCSFTALRPEAECACDSGTGACTLLPGAACAAAEQCQSGACVANGQGTTICCASACGTGLFCSGDGSSCVACEGDAVACEGNTERRCNAGVIANSECPNGCTPGTGCNDLPPLGFPCQAGQCASPNVCQQDTTGQARCCSRDCAAEDKVCAENGSCICQPGQVQVGADCLLANGDPCQDSQQCQVGSSCSEGVCCQEACTGACERCEPNTGLCVAIGAGQQDALCGAGRQCNGTRGDCRLTVGQPCAGNGAECTTNNCEPTVGNAALICCAQGCGADRPFCRSDGTSCVQCEANADCGNGCNTFTGLCNESRSVGSPCTNSAECAAGAACVADGSSQLRCCERDCSLTGQECNAQGICVEPLKQDGEACIAGDECASSVCTRWLPDLDGDGVGSTFEVSGQASLSTCGATAPPPLTVFQGNLPCFGGGARSWPYVPATVGEDCCDHPCPGVALDTISSALVFPGSAESGAEEANCAAGVFTFDYDCSGAPEVIEPNEGPFPPPCNAAPNEVSSIECGARNGFTRAHECGQANPRQFCGLVGGLCASIAADTNPFVPACH